VTDATDIHYDTRYCTECHEKIPGKGKDKFLKFGGDYHQLCRCHYRSAGRDLHPVDITPSKEMGSRIPAGFPLNDGKITCGTCHDIYIQCQENQKPFQKGQNFLRGGLFNQRTGLCYECHDRTKFRMYNPHRQLDNHGDMIQETCLYCHSEIPDVTRATNRDIRLIGNYEALCMRCHIKNNKDSLHDRHVRRRPTASILARMKQMEKELNIILPLNNDGDITCVTCHNPHEKGLIPNNRVGAIGAGERKRQRLPENVCIKCHNL